MTFDSQRETEILSVLFTFHRQHGPMVFEKLYPSCPIGICPPISLAVKATDLDETFTALIRYSGEEIRGVLSSVVLRKALDALDILNEGWKVSFSIMEWGPDGPLRDCPIPGDTFASYVPVHGLDKYLLFLSGERKEIELSAN